MNKNKKLLRRFKYWYIKRSREFSSSTEFGLVREVVKRKSK